MKHVVFGAMTALFFVKTAFVAINTIGISRFLRHRQIPEESGADGPAIYILVPLLREQARFETCFRRFAGWLEHNERFRLCFVTTERERLERTADADHEETAQLVEDAFTRTPALKDRLFHYHYPTLNRTLAEQLEFAFHRLYNEESFDRDRDFILLYNADSDPRALSASYFLRAAAENVRVAQQSALFLGNIDDLIEAGQLGCAADAVFQSRWTLQEEMPRLIRSAIHIRQRLAVPIVGASLLAHCVSHGLLIQGSVIQSIGGFPVPRVGMEDSALGFALRAREIPIAPCPFLESADAATEFRMLMRQKVQWFLGPMGAFEYARRGAAAGADAWRVRRLLAESMFASMKWLLGGLAAVGYVVLGYASGHGALAVCVYVLYCAVPVSVLLTVADARELRASIRRRPLTWIVVFGIYPLAYVWHTVFAVLGLYEYVRLIVMGRAFHQSKTE